MTYKKIGEVSDNDITSGFRKVGEIKAPDPSLFDRPVDMYKNIIQGVGNIAPIAGAILGAEGANRLVEAAGIPTAGASLLTLPIARSIGAGLGAGRGEKFRQETQKAPFRTALKGLAEITQPMGTGPISAGLRAGFPAPPQTEEEKQKQRLTGAFSTGAQGIGEAIFGLGNVALQPVKPIIAKRVLPIAKNAAIKVMNTLPDDFVNYLVKMKDVSKNAISHLKQKGVENVRKAGQNLSDNLDDFFVRLRGGVERVKENAVQMQDDVFANVPETRSFNIQSWIDNTRKKLKNVGRVTGSGQPSATGRQIQASALDEADDIIRTLGSRTKETYIQQTTKSGTHYPKKANATNVNKTELKLLRDKLQKLYQRGTPTEKMIIRDFMDDLIVQGEKQGATGWGAAQKVYSKAMDLSDEFINSYDELKGVNQSAVKNWFDAPKPNRDKLVKFANAIDEPGLIDDLKDVSANKVLKATEKEMLNDDFLLKELFEYFDPAKTPIAKDSLRKFFGADTEKIINHLRILQRRGVGQKVIGGAGVAGGLWLGRKLLSSRKEDQVMEFGGNQ